MIIYAYLLFFLKTRNTPGSSLESTWSMYSKSMEQRRKIKTDEREE
jgi:hypothetical protein